MKFAFGVMPPVEFQWQIGKTAETLQLVNDIEQAIDYLQSVSQKLKEGSLIIEADDNVSVHSLLCSQVYAT
jgi:hypothetical protein